MNAPAPGPHAPGQPAPGQPAPGQSVGRWNYGLRTAVYGGVVLLLAWGAWRVQSMLDTSRSTRGRNA